MISIFQPIVDFSSMSLYYYDLQSTEVYKVWPRQENLEVFVQSRAEGVTDGIVNGYFTPLLNVNKIL